MINKAVKRSELVSSSGRSTVVHRFGEATEPVLREHVAYARSNSRRFREAPESTQ